jgi:hypothetical protein
MLGDGALSAYYAEYASLSGECDTFLAGVMRFMSGKETGAQWKYFDAMLNPVEYLWPDDAKTASPEERLQSLAKMRSAPPRRDDLGQTLADNALPGELLKSLRSISSCADGMKTLDRLKAAGLLFPRGADDSIYENMSADEYERSARQHYLGHTQAALARLSSLRESFRALQPPLDYYPALMLYNTIERVDGLRERRITPCDSLFIANASNLFGKRSSIELSQMTKFIGGGFGGGALFCLIRLVSEGHGVFFFSMTLFLTVVAGGVFYLALAEGANNGRRNRFESIISALFILIFISVQVTLRWSIGQPRDIFHIGGFAVRFMFPFFTGATWGCAISYSLNRYALSKNLNAILAACAEYLKRFAGDKDRDEE